MFIISWMGWEGELRWFQVHTATAGNAKFPLRNPRISPQVPWAISSCLFASPRAEKRSSLILVSALRLFSRCWVLSCMAERADISTSVSFSFSLYFLSSCRGNWGWEGQECHPGGRNGILRGKKMTSWGKKNATLGAKNGILRKKMPAWGKKCHLGCKKWHPGGKKCHPGGKKWHPGEKKSHFGGGEMAPSGKKCQPGGKNKCHLGWLHTANRPRSLSPSPHWAWH